jgi:hypothetical protein
MFQQELAPLGSLTVSALVALLPLLTIFVLLGALRWKAHWAGLAALAVAIIVAVVAYGMPVGLAVLSATEGSACSRSCGSSSPPSGCTRSPWSAGGSKTCAPRST